MQASNLIGLYINFQDNVGTLTVTTAQGKTTANIPQNLLNQIKQLIIANPPQV